MLVLSRRRGEQIKIGDDITVTFVEGRNRGRTARIGIDAPEHLNIVRTELLVESEESPSVASTQGEE